MRIQLRGQRPGPSTWDSPVRLARRFRELAGFEEEEMDTLAEISREARAELDAQIESNRAAAAS